jgi:hypothetical protein
MTMPQKKRDQNRAGFPWPKPKRRSNERDKAIADDAARAVRPVAASQGAESQGP